MRDTVGMVGHLDGGLPAHAELTLIDGMLRVAFKLLGQPLGRHARLAVTNDLDIPFHDPYLQTAAGRAEGADAWSQDRLTRYELFIRDEANQLVFRVAATRECSARAGRSRDLDEFATIHVDSSLVVADQTVLRCLFLLVTVDAEAHSVVYDPFGDCHLGYVSVTGSTLDSGADVWRVIEAHMSLVCPSIDTLPGRFLVSLVVGRERLNRRDSRWQ